MDLYPLHKHVGVLPGCDTVSAELLHAWCGAADELCATLDVQIQWKEEAVHKT